MATHDCGFPQHDGFAPVEADDAAWIIIRARAVAKRAATNGTVGPMSGGWLGLLLIIPGRPERSNPTAFAGLQTRTPKAAHSASAKDGASKSVFATETDSGFRSRWSCERPRNDHRVMVCKWPGMTTKLYGLSGNTAVR